MRFGDVQPEVASDLSFPHSRITAPILHLGPLLNLTHFSPKFFSTDAVICDI